MRPQFDPPVLCCILARDGSGARVVTSEIRRGAPKTGRHLRTHLLWLTLACSIPIVVTACVLGFFFVAHEYERAETTVDERIRLMKNALELRVGNIIEDLQVLASAPALQDDNLALFHAYAVRANDTFGGNGIVLVDRSGQQVVASRQAFGAPLPRRTQLETQNTVFATGQPQVSDLIKAATDGRPIVSVEVPVNVGQEVKYVLATGLSPDYLSAVVREHVPPGWIGSIIDRKGILVARSSDAAGADLIGLPTIPEVRSHVGKAWVPGIKTISRVGVPMYSSLMRSEGLGFSVNLALPRATLDGPVWRAGILLAGVAILALMISFIAARFMSRRLVEAFSALEDHVLAIRGGSKPPPIDTNVYEVAHMQSVLDDVGSDITNAHIAIERERSLLKSTVQSMPIGVLLVDPSGRPILVNDSLLQLWGQSHINGLGELKGVQRFRLDGTEYPAAEWPILRVLKGEENTVSEEVLQSHDGMHPRRLVINAAPVKDGAGSIIAAVIACYDVTELRAALQQQQLLLDEINHRVKNTLATVQSIARLTTGSAATVAGYAEALERRILALSRAYNLLTDNRWEGAELSILVKEIVSPFGSDAVETSGPHVLLSANHSLALAAALQELSTNASKYGALSVPSGRVNAEWRIVAGTLKFSWTERNGPRVVTPTRQGFGTKMIEQNLARETGWTVRTKYSPTGFECVIELPLTPQRRRQSPELLGSGMAS
jgi:two-component sensor histidine kinase